MKNFGILYICPTPIGNLEDMTIRVLNTLKKVDFIGAEDTRHTIKLLNHFDIKAKLISYHEHNKVTAGPNLIDILLSGEDVALVSDAGMPGISDPGEDLVKLAIDAGIQVTALPGASAVVTALAASGLSTRRFFFEGFLDRNKKKRRERLEALKGQTATIVFYESPHRLTDTLKDIQKILGNRKLVIAREITKKYEEYVRGDIQFILDYFSEREIKGEFVLMLEGGEPIEDERITISVEDHLLEMMNQGMSKKEAISEVAKIRKVPKKEIYNIAISIKK